MHADVGSWLRNGVEPAAAVEALGDRLVTLQLDHPDRSGDGGSDVLAALLERIHRLGVVPTLFGTETERSAVRFNQVTVRLADKGAQ